MIHVTHRLNLFMNCITLLPPFVESASFNVFKDETPVFICKYYIKTNVSFYTIHISVFFLDYEY